MSLVRNQIENHDLIRFVTCGNVDDGKSTLIGRLLFDSKMILADTLNTLSKVSQKKGLKDLDLSLLTDGLQSEREQGITIDVAYRYFSTNKRSFIIADSPGHEQYTRNMVTAASTAHLAILLVDARKDLQVQTRRHSLIANLLGIQQRIVAINKMDLIDYDESIYNKLAEQYQLFSRDFNGRTYFVPMSALKGDMIVERGDNMSWYQGPTLMHYLENLPVSIDVNEEVFRFPVQYVCRPQLSGDPDLHDFRGFMGKIESGVLKKGEKVMALPSLEQATVREIKLGAQELLEGISQQSVCVLLDKELDISRGDMLCDLDKVPEVTKQITAQLCWFSEEPLSLKRKYIIQHTSRTSIAKISYVEYLMDINSLEKMSSNTMSLNEIGVVNIKVSQPLFIDPYTRNRATGAFILIDESNHATVGAGMIVDSSNRSG